MKSLSVAKLCTIYAIRWFLYTLKPKTKWTRDKETKAVKASIDLNLVYTRCVNQSYSIE